MSAFPHGKERTAKQRRARDRRVLIHSAGCVYPTCSLRLLGETSGPFVASDWEPGTHIPRSLRAWAGCAVVPKQ